MLAGQSPHSGNTPASSREQKWLPLCKELGGDGPWKKRTRGWGLATSLFLSLSFIFVSKPRMGAGETRACLWAPQVGCFCSMRHGADGGVVTCL